MIEHFFPTTKRKKYNPIPCDESDHPSSSKYLPVEWDTAVAWAKTARQSLSRITEAWLLLAGLVYENPTRFCGPRLLPHHHVWSVVLFLALWDSVLGEWGWLRLCWLERQIRPLLAISVRQPSGPLLNGSMMSLCQIIQWLVGSSRIESYLGGSILVFFLDCEVSGKRLFHAASRYTLTPSVTHSICMPIRQILLGNDDAGLMSIGQSYFVCLLNVSLQWLKDFHAF